ncbi:MAG: P-loop NTPase [Nitrospinae bacterium]|nr:P-loop NTPase [Nitrospinota bacterium]
MKKYSEVSGDGGSGILEQVSGQLGALHERMRGIKRVIVIVSAKGGVGKSFITAMMAKALSNRGYSVGALDADINGSSIPYMLGVDSYKAIRGENGIIPAVGECGAKVMSLDFFTGSNGAPVKWEGPQATHPWLGAMEATAIRELLSDADWGQLDYLLVDTPPSLGRLNDLMGLVPSVSGVVIVTIPSKVSYRVVLKSVDSVRDTGAPIIGVVENMSGVLCRHCNKMAPIFNGGDMTEALDFMRLPLLGSVPFVREGESMEIPEAAINGICDKTVAYVNSAG